MIKLTRGEQPATLTPELQKELTEVFKSSKRSVWQREDIKNALLLSSKQKCAFCECLLKEESKYLEVEHFHHKDEYEDKVIEWENLLPSCRRCNGKKGKHDVIKDGAIINPYDENPKDHLRFRCYRFQAKTDLGDLTIDLLELNNTLRVVKKRMEIGNQVSEIIEQAIEVFEEYQTLPVGRGKTLKRTRLLNMIQGVLEECQPNAAYAASTATCLHNDSKYERLILLVQGAGLWNPTLQDLHMKSKDLSLDYI